ncbi:hypothetical protein Tco_0561385 [Tanacetum coccineum]
MQGIAKVAIGGIRCGVCRHSGEERGTVLGAGNLAGSEDRHTFGVGDDEQLFPGVTNGGVIKGSGVDGNFKGDGFRLGVGPVYHLNGFRLYLGFRVYKA